MKKRLFNILWIILSVITTPGQILLFGFALWFDLFMEDIEELKESFAGF